MVLYILEVSARYLRTVVLFVGFIDAGPSGSTKSSALSDFGGCYFTGYSVHSGVLETYVSAS